MAKFKVVTPAGVTYAGPGAAYDYELEALTPIGAEIVEVAAKSDDESSPPRGTPTRCTPRAGPSPSASSTASSAAR